MTNSHILNWTIYVWLNAGFGFFIAAIGVVDPVDMIGVIAAIFTFVWIYASIDQQLIETGQDELRTQFLWGVGLKFLTQFVPFIDVFAGIASVSFVTETLKIETPIIKGYLTTMVDGILLSLVVLCLMGIVRFIRTYFTAKTG